MDGKTENDYSSLFTKVDKDEGKKWQKTFPLASRRSRPCNANARGYWWCRRAPSTFLEFWGTSGKRRSYDILLLSRELSPPDIIRPICRIPSRLARWVHLGSPRLIPFLQLMVANNGLVRNWSRVCPWNSHTVSREAIQDLGMSAASQMRKFLVDLGVWDFAGNSPWWTDISKVGPQIFNDNDPRIAYEDEQMGLMAGLINSWEIEPEEQEDDKLATFSQEPKKGTFIGEKWQQVLKSIYLCWEMEIELKIAESSQDKASFLELKFPICLWFRYYWLGVENKRAFSPWGDF